MARRRVRMAALGISLWMGLLYGGPTPPAQAEAPDLLWLKGRSPLTYTFMHGPPSFHYSPDGRFFAVTDPNQYGTRAWPFTEIRRADNGDLQMTLPGFEAWFIALESDETGILTRQRDNLFQVHSLADGKLVASYNVEETNIYVSPDGQFVIAETFTLEPRTRSFRVLRSRDGEQLYAKGHFLFWSFAPASNALFVIELDGTLQFLNPANGAVLREIPGGSLDAAALENVGFIALSPDEDTLAVFRPENPSDPDRPLELRRLNDLSLIQTFPGVRAAFSPDGQVLVTNVTGQGDLFWRRTDGGEWVPAFQALEGGSFGHEFSPDGRFLAVRSGEHVRVLRVADGQVVREFASGISGQPLEFTPDGEVLAIANSDTPEGAHRWIDYTLSFRRMSDGRRLDYPEGFRTATALAFSPDGRVLATAGGPLQLWDSREGVLLWSVNTGPDLGLVERIAFSPEGGTLTTYGYRRLQEWDVETGQLLREAPHAPGIASPDGLYYVERDSFHTDLPLEIRRTADDSLVRAIAPPAGGSLRPLSFTADGQALLVITQGIQDASGQQVFTYDVWGIPEGRHLRTLRSIPVGQYAGGVESYANGQVLALVATSHSPSAADRSSTLFVYRLVDGELIHTAAFGGPDAPAGAFTRVDLEGSSYLTSHPEERVLRLWDLTTGGLLQTFPLNEEDRDFVEVKPTPDRSLLMATGFDRVVFWRMADGMRLADYDREVNLLDYPLLPPVEGGIGDIVFSPNGGRMAYLEWGGKALAVASAPLAVEPSPGDVNVDRQVDVRDATMTLRFIIQAAEPTARERRAADMNRDSQVNVGDVVLILRKAIGLPD